MNKKDLEYYLSSESGRKYLKLKIRKECLGEFIKPSYIAKEYFVITQWEHFYIDYDEIENIIKEETDSEKKIAYSVVRKQIDYGLTKRKKEQLKKSFELTRPMSEYLNTVRHLRGLGITDELFPRPKPPGKPQKEPGITNNSVDWINKPREERGFFDKIIYIIVMIIGLILFIMFLLFIFFGDSEAPMKINL